MSALIALKAFPYAGGSISDGDVFEPMSVFDATALIAGRMAIREDVISDEREGDTHVRRRRRPRQVAVTEAASE